MANLSEIFENVQRMGGGMVDSLPALVTLGEKHFELAVTGIDGVVAENYQAVSGFEGDVYFTTMGNRLQPIRISCVGGHPDAMCTHGALGDAHDLKKFYETYRVAKGMTLEVTVADMTLRGALVSMRFRFEDKTSGIYVLTLTGVLV